MLSHLRYNYSKNEKLFLLFEYFSILFHFIGIISLFIVMSKNLVEIKSSWNQYQGFFLNFIYLFPGGMCQALLNCYLKANVDRKNQ